MFSCRTESKLGGVQAARINHRWLTVVDLPAALHPSKPEEVETLVVNDANMRPLTQLDVTEAGQLVAPH